VRARYQVSVIDRGGPRDSYEFPTFPELLAKVRELRPAIDPNHEVLAFCNVAETDQDFDGLTEEEREALEVVS